MSTGATFAGVARSAGGTDHDTDERPRRPGRPRRRADRARSAALYRSGTLAPFTQTTGMAMGYMQGSPVIVPGDLALEFLTFCQRNPKPCPVIGVSERGSPALPTLGADIDVRTDIGGYRIWRHGELVDEVTDIQRSVAR